jgi:NAD-dependent SIR2 family protein deacetylase
MKTVIFLGAGASAAEGAPLQKDLFREYFKKMVGQHDYDEMNRELATYFQLVFSLDCDNGDLDRLDFPTFEEALGVVDLALVRNESLKYFHNIYHATNSNRLAFIRQYLVFLLARVIDDKLRKSKGIHSMLVKNLSKLGALVNTSFISTNYDILIDNALVDQYPRISIDYGIDFANFDRKGDWSRPQKNAIQLLKIHGSLNWLFCSTCNTVTLTPKEKGIIRLFTRIDESYCKDCETVFSPIIIPPTFYKDMSNVYLQTIWNKVEKVLRESKHIVFCGYSFPDADIHIKYLLKRAQTNRKLPVSYSVVNNHSDKTKEMIELEKNRFARFLGKVEYTELSFEEFAKNPSKLVK